MVELKQVENGLEIILTDREEFESRYIEDNEVRYVDVFEILDDGRYIGNGWDDLTNNIGLTEAPAIGYDVPRDEDGDIKIDEESKVYYYSNYMITNPWEVMYNEGKVFFELIK
jgi:hypothetical protein